MATSRARVLLFYSILDVGIEDAGKDFKIFHFPVGIVSIFEDAKAKPTDFDFSLIFLNVY